MELLELLDPFFARDSLGNKILLVFRQVFVHQAFFARFPSKYNGLNKI
jgi:hypothetical protein